MVVFGHSKGVTRQLGLGESCSRSPLLIYQAESMYKYVWVTFRRHHTVAVLVFVTLAARILKGKHGEPHFCWVGFTFR